MEKNAKNNSKTVNGLVMKDVEHIHINVSYKNTRIINQKCNAVKKKVFV